MSKKLLNLCMVALLSVISTAAWALDKVDGVYQIGTAEDLKAFAELVNGTEPYANAVLTADIDKGTENYRIGRDGQDFQGVFDGAGHTITYNMTFEENGAGLFRNVGVHALIQNLKVQGTINTNSSFAGSIAGWNSGRIRGCYADVTINSSKSGDATDGGLVGIAYRGTVIENCLAKVKILGESTQNCGGVVGWANDKINIMNCLIVSDGSTLDVSNGASANIARNGGNINVVNLETYNTNPYGNRPAGANYNNYVTQQWGNNNATTVVPLADLADGRICYQLNNDQSKINWVQKIGTDPFPVPAAFGEGQVYASGATGCNGQGEGLTYSNEGTVQATAHTFDKYGICSVCGCYNFNGLEFDVADNAVLFKTADDIYLAEGWNRIGDGFKLNMKMVDDIEVPAGGYIFNTSNWVDGNFDGQGHTLTINMTEGEHVAFIPEMTGNFENVIMHGSITTSGSRAGSISANGRMALIRNVYSDINITSSLVGDNTSGGFCGWMGDKEKRVENCIYAGTFTLPGADGGARCARVGGFSGWAATKTYFTNCAVLGKFIGAGNQTLDNDTENSGNISRNYGNVVSENVYVLNPIVGNSVGDADKYTFYGEVVETTETNEEGEEVTTKIYVPNTEGVANGELTFLLNGKESGLDRFYQLIGTDPNPLPVAKEGALVYCVAAEYRCDGTPLGDDVTYSNSEASANIPDHTNVDGWCTVCGALQEDYITPVDGWYEISNGTQLAWWSNYATKYPTVKGRLTADINMSGKMAKFRPIGSQASLFVGEFDGQGHVIKNFVLTSSSDYQGLFGVIGGGAVIKNFVLDSTCSITGGAFCGAIGGTNGGGDVYISNLGNEGTVTGSAQNASGILGVDMSGAATLHITNCYVTGAVKGARESATICSWSNSASVIKDCWSSATLEGIYGTGSFTRGQTSVVNCYEVDIEGIDGQQYGDDHTKDKTNLITAEEIANGALCAKLNTVDFRQNVGEDTHPVFNQTHAVVKEITEAGYATMYIPAEVTIPNGVSVFTGEFEETWLKLNPVEGTVPALEPVVLKGAKGYYGFMPAAAATESVDVVFSSLGYANEAVIPETVEVGNLTLNFAQGTNTQNLAPKYYTASGGSARIYAGNTMSISAGGATITKIVFTLSNNGVPTFESGSYDAGSYTWEGEETTVTVGASAQVRIKSMVVYYSVAGEGTANIEGNVLKGTAEEIDAAGKYILAQPEGEPVGFYLANGGKIAAGKAYLEVEGEVKAFLFSEDDATGIANVEKTIENGAIYNLAGQRISKMQKGVNIINGKKVLK
ncbi:MAG: hypothetical protein IKU02_08475 [Bacteroidaceae bacterium]|nr:hypothetical protein [Bacteroidaceae bacterium]